ncbi:MAG: class IV adenylate cyclase [Candidatus Woesearchaeota archaeon]
MAMATEHETKVLDIDREEVEKKIISLGAEKEPEVFMRRWVFDLNPEGHEWLRLRDNGHNVTIAYKRKDGMGVSETEEIETAVEDFEKAYEILSRLHFKAMYYRESRRQMFRLDDIEFTIDTWPGIKPLLEIEAGSGERVNEGLRMLGLEGKDCGNLCMKEVYKMKGINPDSRKRMTFEDFD